MPAICLAIVQNYTYGEREGRWQLYHEVQDDMDMSPEKLPKVLLVKRACEQFTDRGQQELSEVMCRSMALAACTHSCTGMLVDVCLFR